MPGWGNVLGKVFDWLPGRKEAKQNELSRLERENVQLQKKFPFTVIDSARYTANADRIKLLREEIARIT